MKDNWNEYQTKTMNNKEIPPYLKFALKKFEEIKGIMVDLGCGAGTISEFLIKLGWKVIAIDKDTDVIEARNKELINSSNSKLCIQKSDFKDCNIPRNDLVYANFSIPFCKREEFDKLWQKIHKSISINGRFAGVFFGINDDWKDRKDITFLKKQDVLKLFDNFKIEYFVEAEYDDKTALGKEKHWHNFRVVAKKIK